jgi:predicted ester cyclase
MTHSGDGLGFPATGRKGILHGSSFVRIKDGQITEGWNQMDMQALVSSLRE